MSTNSAELADVILDEAEVAVVPGEAFGTPGYLRLSYALGDDDIAEGIARIAKLVADNCAVVAACCTTAGVSAAAAPARVRNARRTGARCRHRG